MQQEELPEAQRAARGAVGTVPQQQAQGALRPARAQRADSRGDATEKNKKANAARHDETHQTRRALETARAQMAGRGGHGPPPVSRQLCSQHSPQSDSAEEDCYGVTHRARHKKTREKKKCRGGRKKKAVDERVDEERGAASEPPKSAKEHAYEIGYRGVVEADEYSTGTELPSPETREVVRHSEAD